MNLPALIKIAETPAKCEEADIYRRALAAALAGWEVEVEDRKLNLERLLPVLEWRAKEDVRSTVKGLERRLNEFAGRGI